MLESVQNGVTTPLRRTVQGEWLLQKCMEYNWKFNAIHLSSLIQLTVGLMCVQPLSVHYQSLWKSSQWRNDHFLQLYVYLGSYTKYFYRLWISIYYGIHRLLSVLKVTIAVTYNPPNDFTLYTQSSIIPSWDICHSYIPTFCIYQALFNSLSVLISHVALVSYTTRVSSTGGTGGKLLPLAIQLPPQEKLPDESITSLWHIHLLQVAHRGSKS